VPENWGAVVALAPSDSPGEFAAGVPTRSITGPTHGVCRRPCTAALRRREVFGARRGGVTRGPSCPTARGGTRSGRGCPPRCGWPTRPRLKPAPASLPPALIQPC